MSITEETHPGPFDTIESAQEFMVLLIGSVNEAIAEVERDLKEAISEGADRREKALRIVMLKMNQLHFHIQKNQRILKDLRSLRRLLLEEGIAEAV